MKNGRRGRWALVGIVTGAILVIALSGTSQEQEVKARAVTQIIAPAQIAANPLAQWDAEYPKALEQARQLQASNDSREQGEQLELELKELDETLRRYVRISERLRHKNRAAAATLNSLNNSMQMHSRQYQSISNALKAAHDVEMASIKNTK